MSTSQLESARGLTSLVVSNKEYAVYKGTDNDDPILQPIGIINKLKKQKLLPHDCYVDRVNFPGSSMKRSALFGVSYIDLALRHDSIRNYIDANIGKFPAMGDECLRLISQMMAHAYVYAPEAIQEDAMLQGLCIACSDPVIFKALKQGAAKPIVQLLEIAGRPD